MSDASILVNRRETQGKNANRRLRAGGHIPAVVYGGERDPVNIQVGQRDFEALLRKTADDNPIFLLELDGTGQKRHAMIRELHADTVTNEILHIDFLRVNMDQELQTSVRLELKGESPGV
ncbi:MAG: 50S ribosomal protein L25, partial [Acidobacteriota bacterium]